MILTKIFGLDSLLNKLKAKLFKKKVTTFEVGYDTTYAIYVHENMQAYHSIGKAKYLSDPYKRLESTMRFIIKKYTEDRKLEEGLRLAAKLLYDASQQEVPVDTGLLKSSGYIKMK